MTLRYCWLHSSGRRGQTSRRPIICSSPHTHYTGPSSKLYLFMDALFCSVLALILGDLSRSRKATLPSASGRDLFGLEDLCGVFSRWLDQRVNLFLWRLTEWGTLGLDFNLFSAGFWSNREWWESVSVSVGAAGHDCIKQWVGEMLTLPNLTFLLLWMWDGNMVISNYS